MNGGHVFKNNWDKMARWGAHRAGARREKTWREFVWQQQAEGTHGGMLIGEREVRVFSRTEQCTGEGPQQKRGAPKGSGK